MFFVYFDLVGHGEGIIRARPIICVHILEQVTNASILGRTSGAAAAPFVATTAEPKAKTPSVPQAVIHIPYVTALAIGPPEVGEAIKISRTIKVMTCDLGNIL